MKNLTPSVRRWCIALLLHCCCLCHGRCCAAFSTPVPSSPRPRLSSSFIVQQPTSRTSDRRRRRRCSLRISTVDVEVPQNDDREGLGAADSASDDNLLSWKDALPISLFVATCLLGATLVSTYEDYDVTHVRPNPSSLRVPSSATSGASFGDPAPSWRNDFGFLGAATRGMGWGPSDRGIANTNRGGSVGGGGDANDDFFEEWYGTSATTLQWKPSYNEVMLQHRSERVPRWNELGNANEGDAADAKERLQKAVLQLYRSLDDLDELKAMADDYMWDDMKERLNPPTQTIVNKNGVAGSTDGGYSLPVALEYSMDVLKSSKVELLPELVGFDWGSCAWRHCGAKADAQEALAELQTDVGMLEPFECRFIIDIVERSIRDVLAVVPDELRPRENGVAVQPRPYVAYVSTGNNDEETIEYEYEQALAGVRVDLSSE